MISSEGREEHLEGPTTWQALQTNINYLHRGSQLRWYDGPLGREWKSYADI